MRLAVGLGSALVVCAILAFGASPQGSFHFDDGHNITDYPPVQMNALSWGALEQAAAGPWGRSLTRLTFAVDWWRGGGEPKSFLVTNLVIHCCNAIILFAFLATCLGRWCEAVAPPRRLIAASLCAALWVLHPMQVQVVAYIVQRAAALAHLFVMSSALAYVRARTSRGRHRLAWTAVTVVTAALGALSKESAWSLPVLLLIVELGVVRRESRLWSIPWVRVITIALGIAFVLLAADLASGRGPLASWLLPSYESREFTLGERLLTQPRVVFLYLGLWLMPRPGAYAIARDLEVSTSLLTPATTAVALLGLVTWSILALWLVERRGRRPLGFGLLWAVACLPIENGPVALEMVFEHRWLMPGIGLTAALAWGSLTAFDRHRRARATAVIAGVLVSMWLAIVTRGQVEIWRDEVTLWTHAREKAPTSARVYNNVGKAQVLAGNVDEAEAAFRRALGHEPQMLEAQQNLGKLLSAERGRHGEALGVLKAAIDHDPKSSKSWLLYGNALVRADQLARAETALDRAIELDPGSLSAWLARGELSLREERFAAATRDFEHAIELQRSNGAAWEGLARAHFFVRDYQRAVADAETGLRFAPERASLHLVRGVTLQRLGRTTDALESVARACELGSEKGCALSRSPPPPPEEPEPVELSPR